MHSEVIQARVLKSGCTSVNFKGGLEGTVRFAEPLTKGCLQSFATRKCARQYVSDVSAVRHEGNDSHLPDTDGAQQRVRRGAALRPSARQASRAQGACPVGPPPSVCQARHGLVVVGHADELAAPWAVGFFQHRVARMGAGVFNAVVA